MLLVLIAVVVVSNYFFDIANYSTLKNNLSASLSSKMSAEFNIWRFGAGSFESDPKTGKMLQATIVKVGERTSFNWSTTNADSGAITVSVDGGPAAPWGGMKKEFNSPLQGRVDYTWAPETAGHTYTYTYAAARKDGQKTQLTRSITVEVPKVSAEFNIWRFANLGEFEIDSRTKSPIQVNLVKVGQRTSFNWRATNADSASLTVSVDGGPAAPWGGTKKEFNSSLQGRVDYTWVPETAGHTYTYTYTVTGKNGQKNEVTRSITVEKK